ncbi:MAG TPA: NAD(P)-dependent oxidoreductase [Actinopolymorphaceae bacterium]
MSSVAVLGLGTMGGRAAARLVSHGHEVHGYDPAASASEAAAGAGVHVRNSADEAVRSASLVVLSLPRPEHVLAAANGPLTAAAEGTIVADLSTIDPGTARSCAEVLGGHGISYVDAPVLGRPDRCGHWTLAVGGSEMAISQVRAVLEGTIATSVVRVGDVGAGSVVKVLNNLMFGAINAVTAEALNACRLAGVDPAVFVSTVADSGAATVSNLFREMAPRLLANDYKPAFALSLLQKDNRLALQLADQVGAPTFVATCVDQVNTLAANLGYASHDAGAVQELYRSLSGSAERQ